VAQSSLIFSFILIRKKNYPPENSKTIPFTSLRYFLVNQVPQGEVRDNHGHRSWKQYLICFSGTCEVITNNGQYESLTVLDGINKGLYISEMVLDVQHKYSSDGVLLVFASEHYDEADYIRNFDTYLKLVKERADDT
jgi:UDP-2-acetamido-3-amino-2,3-dideoxy-glucuronate N-acetyltransferase